MDSSLAGTADQAKAGPEPAQAAIAPGKPETSAELSQVKKEETHQLDLSRDLQCDDSESLSKQA